MPGYGMKTPKKTPSAKPKGKSPAMPKRNGRMLTNKKNKKKK